MKTLIPIWAREALAATAQSRRENEEMWDQLDLPSKLLAGYADSTTTKIENHKLESKRFLQRTNTSTSTLRTVANIAKHLYAMNGETTQGQQTTNNIPVLMSTCILNAHSLDVMVRRNESS